MCLCCIPSRAYIRQNQPVYMRLLVLSVLVFAVAAATPPGSEKKPMPSAEASTLGSLNSQHSSGSPSPDRDAVKLSLATKEKPLVPSAGRGSLSLDKAAGKPSLKSTGKSPVPSADASTPGSGSPSPDKAAGKPSRKTTGNADEGLPEGLNRQYSSKNSRVSRIVRAESRLTDNLERFVYENSQIISKLSMLTGDQETLFLKCFRSAPADRELTLAADYATNADLIRKLFRKLENSVELYKYTPFLDVPTDTAYFESVAKRYREMETLIEDQRTLFLTCATPAR